MDALLERYRAEAVSLVLSGSIVLRRDDPRAAIAEVAEHFGRAVLAAACASLATCCAPTRAASRSPPDGRAASRGRRPCDSRHRRTAAVAARPAVAGRAAVEASVQGTGLCAPIARRSGVLGSRLRRRRSRGGSGALEGGWSARGARDGGRRYRPSLVRRGQPSATRRRTGPRRHEEKPTMLSMRAPAARGARTRSQRGRRPCVRGAPRRDAARARVERRHGTRRELAAVKGFGPASGSTATARTMLAGDSAEH